MSPPPRPPHGSQPPALLPWAVAAAPGWSVCPGRSVCPGHLQSVLHPQARAVLLELSPSSCHCLLKPHRAPSLHGVKAQGPTVAPGPAAICTPTPAPSYLTCSPSFILDGLLFPRYIPTSGLQTRCPSDVHMAHNVTLAESPPDLYLKLQPPLVLAPPPPF